MSLSCTQALHSQEQHLQSQLAFSLDIAISQRPQILSRATTVDSNPELCHHHRPLKRQEACQRFHMH